MPVPWKSVDADKIVVRCDDGTTDTYELIKFMRSNQGTCVNQRPIVELGDHIEPGEVIADGPPPRTAKSAWVRTPWSAS